MWQAPPRRALVAAQIAPRAFLAIAWQPSREAWWCLPLWALPALGRETSVMACLAAQRAGLAWALLLIIPAATRVPDQAGAHKAEYQSGGRQRSALASSPVISLKSVKCTWPPRGARTVLPLWPPGGGWNDRQMHNVCESVWHCGVDAAPTCSAGGL